MNEYKVKKILLPAILFLALSIFISAAPLTGRASSTSVQVWWPTNGAHVSGNQPLKAMVPGSDVSQYNMFWQVDGGQWNWMNNNYTDYQHKEADISVAGWNWHGNGPYTINFIAQQNGVIVAQQSEQIYIDNGQPVQLAAPIQAPTPAPAPVVVVPPVVVAPLVVAPAPVVVPTPVVAPAMPVTSNSTFYVDPLSEAAMQASVWVTSNPVGAAAMQKLATQPTATWFGNWNSNIQTDVHTRVTKAAAQNTMPVLVAYNIPERDCGGFSAGGSNNSAGYTSWIQSFASGIGNAPATVILEPDALAGIGCLSVSDQATRLQLLHTAVQTLKANTNTKVYIDAGHANWIDPNTMAQNLTKAGVVQADGFSLNVSNFDATQNEINYGTQVSAALQQSTGQSKHFVIDTGRNGNGSDGNWCNPLGRAIGTTPTTVTGNLLVDAYLWIKTPGESDGSCNGGPSAGTWWPSYAQALVQNVH